MALAMRRSLCVVSSLLQARALATKVAEQGDDLFFQKLLTGREIANPALASSREEQQLFAMAQNMQNQQYLVGRRRRRSSSSTASACAASCAASATPHRVVGSASGACA